MSTIELKPETYSDVVFVEGVYNHKRVIENALYLHCKKYFDQNYRGVFFAGSDKKDEIFQESFITLWEIIEHRIIYVEDGELKGKNGKPFKGRLTTFFMSIARFKYLEWVRKNSSYNEYGNDELESMKDVWVFLDNVLENNIQYEILSYCISQMPKGCNRILTMFYYEEKNLDAIMMEIPTYKSKNALKTAKHKCMENLRSSANAIYDRYINA